jgi:hypothetical protein
MVSTATRENTGIVEQTKKIRRQRLEGGEGKRICSKRY